MNAQDFIKNFAPPLGAAEEEKFYDQLEGFLNFVRVGGVGRASMQVLYQLNQALQVIAFIAFDEHYGAGRVCMVSVHNHYRRQGRAAELLRLSCQKMIEIGLTGRFVGNTLSQEWEKYGGKWRDKIKEIVKRSGLSIVEDK